MKAVRDNVEVTLDHGLRFWRTSKLLHIQLPSGRVIRYYDPGLTDNRFGKPSIDYQGYQTNGPWGRVESYGPKFVENIVQAASRDALRDSMLNVAKKYPGIVMHIHDEMVVEVPKDGAEDALKEIQALMGQPVPWAPGLLLRGDGYLTDYYKKD
jgi:DNA polymerase